MAAGGEKWGLFNLVALAVCLLVMIPQTMQLSIDHPLYGILHNLNEKEGPFLGIILPDSDSAQNLFLQSGYFEPRPDNPTLTIHGRKFNIGKFRGMNAICTPAGRPLASVGVTVQILLDNFRIMGIISYGTSGTTTDKLAITNVAVPTHVAYVGVWAWQGSELERCINGTMCSEGVPEIVRGLRTASSDIYVSNVAYANFLRDNLDVAAVDTASAAVVATSVANGVPHIVFRAASNRPGVPYDAKLSREAGENVLKVVAAFVDRLSQKIQPHITIY